MKRTKPKKKTRAAQPTLPPTWEAMVTATSKPFADGGAYSSDCSADWRGCAVLLYTRGATLAGAEDVLRSKHMRWCSDSSPEPYGHATVEHFARYLDTTAGARAMAGIVDPAPNACKPILSAAQSAGVRFAAALTAALDAMPEDDPRYEAAREALAIRIRGLASVLDLEPVIAALPPGEPSK